MLWEHRTRFLSIKKAPSDRRKTCGKRNEKGKFASNPLGEGKMALHPTEKKESSQKLKQGKGKNYSSGEILLLGEKHFNEE